MKEGNSNAEYIFEFNKKEDYVLNFYTHNLKAEKIKISMQVSASPTADDKSG